MTFPITVNCGAAGRSRGERARNFTIRWASARVSMPRTHGTSRCSSSSTRCSPSASSTACTGSSTWCTGRRRCWSSTRLRRSSSCSAPCPSSCSCSRTSSSTTAASRAASSTAITGRCATSASPATTARAPIQPDRTLAVADCRARWAAATASAPTGRNPSSARRSCTTCTSSSSSSPSRTSSTPPPRSHSADGGSKT